MKFLKKLCITLSGVTKYLIHMNKVIQAVRLISQILPQIAAMVKPEQKDTLEQISSTLAAIAGKMETTEKYLNDMGITTSAVEDDKQKRAPQKLTLKRAAKLLDKIDKSIPERI